MLSSKSLETRERLASDDVERYAEFDFRTTQSTENSGPRNAQTGYSGAHATIINQVLAIRTVTNPFPVTGGVAGNGGGDRR